jgi:hypothetical protein
VGETIQSPITVHSFGSSKSPQLIEKCAFRNNKTTIFNEIFFKNNRSSIWRYIATRWKTIPINAYKKTSKPSPDQIS